MQIWVREKSFYRQVLRLVLPVAAQSMITMGINLMDTIMLGKFGEMQLSASSLANQFINLFQILCMGIGCGAAVLTAQCWGKKDLPALKKVVTLMLRLCLLAACAFTAAVCLFPRQIMGIYTSQEAVIAYGEKYFSIMRYTFFVQGLSLTMTQVLRSVRNVRIPMISSVCSFFINIFFNWVFIFGNLGAPRMEIAGAALGTLIARVFECAIIFGYAVLADRQIGYRLRELFRPCGEMLSPFLRYSGPVVISDMLLGLGNNALSVVMGHISAEFVAASAMTNVTVQLSTVFVFAVASASASITGNTVGAGQKEKAYQQGVTFLGISTVLGVFACLLILATSPLVINMYEVADHTKEIAYSLMAAIGIIVLFRCPNTVMTKGVLRGGGDTKFLMAADILFLWVFSIPLGAMAGLVWHLPPFWIYFCLMSDNILKCIWCVWRLLGKKWVREIV